MRLRILGCHNLETSNSRHTCFLIDGRLAIDAGSLVRGLDAGELAALEAVLLSHCHFDHVRDVPTIGLAALHQGRSVEVWASAETLAAVHRHLLNGTVYPDFTGALGQHGPSLRFQPAPLESPFPVLDYQVRTIPVPHPVPCVGFIVRSADQGCIGYTGDSGGRLRPFLESAWRPEFLCVDLSFPNRLGQLAQLTGHLTPELLGRELTSARASGLELPRLVAVHRSVEHEAELREDLEQLCDRLQIEVIWGDQDQELVSGGLTSARPGPARQIWNPSD